MAKRRKIYYPDGQIQKGLYTQGGEWMFADGTEYVGDYHTYSTGEVFTKSSYVKNVSEKLIPYVDLSIKDNSEKFRYDSIASQLPQSFYFPVYRKTLPLEDNYLQGYFFRYFVKKYHSPFVVEVTKDTYSATQVEHFAKAEIPWKLVGTVNDSQKGPGVFDTNRRIISGVNKIIDGILNYVTDFTEYARLQAADETSKDNSRIVINEGVVTNDKYLGDGEIPAQNVITLPGDVPDPGGIFIPNGAVVTADGSAVVTADGSILVIG